MAARQSGSDATAADAGAGDASAGDGQSNDKRSLRVWLQLMKCSRAVEAEVNARLRRNYGQSLARFDALSQLYRFGEDWVTVGTLAEHMLTASKNITALLDRMQGEGLIERRASPVDRRSFHVRPTARGRALFDKMARDHARWVDEAWADIGIDDKDRLIELLVGLRAATRGFDALDTETAA